MATLNNKKIDKIISKMDPKEIKSTMSLVMFICDIIEKTHNEDNVDKIKLFIDHGEEIAKKLVDSELISEDLIKNLHTYTDIVEDFFELWGRTKKVCKFNCIK